MAQTHGRRIVLGVSGGIAAYKAAELVRLLIKDGSDVQVVMTEAACGFITPATMQALSGKPVFTNMWDGRVADNMAHIALSRGADAIVIAPASAAPPATVPGAASSPPSAAGSSCSGSSLTSVFPFPLRIPLAHSDSFKSLSNSRAMYDTADMVC